MPRLDSPKSEAGSPRSPVSPFQNSKSIFRVLRLESNEAVYIIMTGLVLGFEIKCRMFYFWFYSA